MVKFVVQAKNDKDVYLRYWGLFVDSPPLDGWDHGTAPNVQPHMSGDTMSADLPVSDGKHTVYFITSQPLALEGPYSGTINADSKSAAFTGAGITAAVGMDIEVSGGAVVSETPRAGGSSSGFEAKFKGFIDKVKQNKTAAIVISVISTVGLTIGVVVVAKMKKSKF